MKGEIISAEEARRMREAATPGPWRHINGVDDPQPGWGRFPSVVSGSSDDPQEIAIVRNWCDGDASLMAAAPDLARTVEHLHAEIASEREAVLAFLLGMARTAETAQARGLIATIRRAIELRYHRDPLRTPRADGEVSDG